MSGPSNIAWVVLTIDSGKSNAGQDAPYLVSSKVASYKDKGIGRPLYWIDSTEAQ
jgi:hypothetical protein